MGAKLDMISEANDLYLLDGVYTKTMLVVTFIERLGNGWQVFVRIDSG